MKITVGYYKNYTRHITILCFENLKIFSVKAGGTQYKHYVLTD